MGVFIPGKVAYSTFSGISFVLFFFIPQNQLLNFYQHTTEWNYEEMADFNHSYRSVPNSLFSIEQGLPGPKCASLQRIERNFVNVNNDETVGNVCRPFWSSQLKCVEILPHSSETERTASHNTDLFCPEVLRHSGLFIWVP